MLLISWPSYLLNLIMLPMSLVITLFYDETLRALIISIDSNACFIKVLVFWEFYTSIWIESIAVCLLAWSRLYTLLAADFVMASINFPCFLAHVFGPSFHIKITVGIVKRPLRKIKFSFSIMDILTCDLVTSSFCLFFIFLKPDQLMILILLKCIDLQYLGSSNKRTANSLRWTLLHQFAIL